VVGDLLGVFDGAAVFQVSGDAGGPEGVVANVFGQADRLGPSFYHPQGVVAIHRPGGQLAVRVEGAEERGFLLAGVAGDAGGGEISIDVGSGVVVGWQLVP
jgi:hypothetical protein